MDVNVSFRNICRVLFKEELGDYLEYEKMLTRYVDPLKQTKSAISGKDVYYSEPYCKDAKFISLEEMKDMKIEPLQLDEMKDIDNLLNAIQERFYYSGNKILGKSEDIEKGDNCVDCFHSYDSYLLFNCEHVIKSQMALESKFIAGCAWGGYGSFCMNTTEFYNVSRCFEATFTISSNDAYLCYNCRNCNEIMFSLNQFSKRYCIGNTELPKERYLTIKEKIINEIANELKKNKTFPSLIELTSEVIER